MIKPNTAYVIPFETTLNGDHVAADALPTVVLWRNGSAEFTAVIVTTTANVGVYHATFTTDAGWAATDRIWLFGSALIEGNPKYGVFWTSFAEPEGTVVQELTAYGAATATNVSDGTTAITNKLPDTLVNGRIKSVISDEQVIDVGNQIVLATLQTNPASVATRSIEDNKPLTFSWPNSTDTITGEVSIDNGAYVAVEGAIAYLREEDGKFYFTLAYDAADRPAEEGTARYKFSSSNFTMYATLRITVTDPATVGDWAVKRTFEYNGETVQGVRLSLVGISGKANTSGINGIAQINANNGTFVLRTVVPVGFESIPDEVIVLNGADNISLVELTPMAIPTVADGLCVLQLHLRSQGTTEVIPLTGVNVTAKLVGGPKVIGSVLHLDIVDTATTDSNGYAPLVLLQNTIYDLSITLTNSIHIKKIRITTPETSSAVISEVV